ncbi:hypothetical protein F4809DRAFT_629343 [Biscogniauxia mediterranea]|nr:hypothetical protein F4809DRAFT_629343 [Biscogniauxia mediterranea]
MISRITWIQVIGEMAEWLWRCVQVYLDFKKLRSGAIRVGSSPTLINKLHFFGLCSPK